MRKINDCFLNIYAIVNKVLDKYLIGFRKKHINNLDFSIICNNCWGGYVYRRFGLPYLSPTVGLYFFADDFIKLCSNVREYMETPLEFIDYTESRYREEIEAKKQTNVPIARLGDIEIVFLHYATREEAAEKWARRVERINYNNLIFKFSKMNCCSDEHLQRFDELEYKKKICFVPPNGAINLRCGIDFKSADGNTEICNDTREYSRYINITRMINSEKVCGNRMEGKRRKK